LGLTDSDLGLTDSDLGLITEGSVGSN
jgi:hypothetical protein